MERESTNQQADVIELGCASTDTHGNGGIYWEAAGLMPHAGIDED